MSHVLTIKGFVVRSLDHAEAACRALGSIELVRDQTEFMCYAKKYGSSNKKTAVNGHCAHAIRRVGHQPGDYEIGLVPVGDAYAVAFDNFDTGAYFAHALGGGNLPQLAEEYHYAEAADHFAAKGMMLQRQYNDRNQLQLSAYTL